MNHKAMKFPINLFCSLMLLSFIPFIYTLVRTNLIANIPLTDGLGIAGHLEWFDLINETIQAFLIVNVVYILFAVIILFHCHNIVSAMAIDHIHEVTRYLELFKPNITVICMMFGFGMVTHWGCSIICFFKFNFRRPRL